MIQQVFKNQTALQIKLITGINLTNVRNITPTGAKIKYRKPDATEGEWEAFIDNAEFGSIFYDVQNTTDLDQVGEWVLWSHITFLDGRSAPGATTTLQVIDEGTN